MPPSNHSGASLKPSNNLSDLFDASTARTNLGLGSAALKADTYYALASHTHAISQITGLQAILDALALSNDSRFPSADEKSALAGTNGTPSNGNRYVTNSDTRNTDARTPLSHSHVVADLPVAADAEVSSSKVVRANDSRLSDSRTPLTHTHVIAALPVASDAESSSTKVVRADDSRLSNARTSVGAALNSAKIVVGNGSNVGAAVDISGDVEIDNAGEVTVTGIQGKAITKFLTATGSKNFGNIATQATVTASIAVTGAAVGDLALIALPNGSPAGVTFNAYCSANTVTIKAVNASGSTVPVGTADYTVYVIGV